MCTKLCYFAGNCAQTIVPELRCDHKEADTRMLLHAKYAVDVEKYDTAVIKCQDTDVFVMCLAFGYQFPQLVFSTGKSDKSRLINMTKACQQLSQNVASALLSGHALSGCDSTSAFHGKGKKKMFQLIVSNDRFHDVLMQFGKTFTVDEAVIERLQELICLLYGVDSKSLNEAKYAIFCSPSKVSESSLPPTQDEFFLHAKRAWYQTAIWKSCLCGVQNAPKPTAYGWIEKDGALEVQCA